MSGSSSAMRIRYAMVSVSFAVVLVFAGPLWVRNLSRFSISLEILFFIYFSIFVPFIFVVRTTVLHYNDYRIFPYIPFYIARYEKEISLEKDVAHVVADLAYFRDAMLCLRDTGELSDGEMIDLMGFVNTIITHITNGNKNEERLVNVMGGTIIETESEKWMRRGQAKMIVELGQEDGLDDASVIERLQKKMGVSFETASMYLAQYGRRLG